MVASSRPTVPPNDQASNGNLARLKVDQHHARNHDWLERPEGPVLNKRFDRILVEVPCSNSGVMRRRVDVRWCLKEDDFTALAETQFQLLNTSVNVLKPGGIARLQHMQHRRRRERKGYRPHDEGEPMLRPTQKKNLRGIEMP